MPKNYTKATGYKPENHDGKTFRVRDKDHGDGKPVTVWGDGLSHADANKLKEIVTGQAKSTTARVEPMDIPSKPNWVRNAVVIPVTTIGKPATIGPNGLITPSTPRVRDPQLAAVHARALAAGRGVAQQAQQRADAAATPVPAPVPEPEPVDDLDDDALAELEGEDADIDAEDLAAAAEVASEEFAVLDGKGEALYKAFMIAVKNELAIPVAKEIAATGDTFADLLARVLPEPHTDVEWSKLDESNRAEYRFEANAGDGPHVRFIFAVDAAETAKLGSDAPMAQVIKDLAKALSAQQEAPAAESAPTS